MDLQPSAGVPEPAGPALSVVIPCHNEASVLRETHRRVSAVCRAAVGEDHELVLVNDGSRDDTWDLMQALSQQDHHLVCVDLSRNFGHQAALMAVAPAGLSFLQNALELLVRLDESLPKLRA